MIKVILLSQQIFLPTLLCLLGMIPCTFGQGQGDATIRGIVTLDGRALPDVPVLCYQIPDNGKKEPRVPSSQVRTDGEGKFSCQGLTPGTYLILPAYTGLVLQQDSFQGPMGKGINLQAGEQIDNIDLKMTAGGIITGKILNQDGQPVIGQAVRLILIEPKVISSEALIRNKNMFLTDDQGEFRLYGIPQGRYKLCFGYGGEENRSFSAERKSFSPFTCYSTGGNGEEAKILDVLPRQELSGINITLPPPTLTLRIKGRVLLTDSGQPIPRARVSYINGPLDSGGTPQEIVSDAEGQFLINNLTPGRYELYLTPGQPNGYCSKRTTVELNSEDGSVEISASKGAVITGKVIIENKDNDQLLKTLEIVCNSSQNIRTPVSFDGSFSLRGIPRGKVSLHIEGSGQPFLKLRRIERDGVLQSQPFILNEGEEIRNLDLIYQHGNGRVVGTVQIESTQPIPPDARISIALENKGTPSVNGTLTYADSRGRFVINGVPAGQYRVSATLISPLFRNPVPRSKQDITVGEDQSVNIIIILKPGSE
ncbi:MAG: carboxypeptidase-like regulatory domain-containing protein [Blastocatellia bacterium]